MYEGKPLLLVIGGSDTGRAPMTAALLRHALGESAIVLSAGVLSHAGERAAPEAQLALEQVGIDISNHVSRPLDDTEHHQAELLLAVDRGTEMVLFTRFRNDPRVACLPVLAESPDVLDPHRMPLGVWVSIVRQLQDQIIAALPNIRRELGITAHGAPPLEAPHPHEFIPLPTGGGPRWDNDQDMQRLLQLIEDGQRAQPQAESGSNGAAHPTASEHAQHLEITAEAVTIAEPAAELHETPYETTTSADSQAEVATPTGRADHVARLARMLEVAGDVPEIIDWQRMRQQLIERLRSIAQQAGGGTDFAPAAALMIEGKLVQHPALPGAEALFLLQRSVTRLRAPVSATDLATIGGELAQW